jgi:hypothetical protein
MTWLTNIEWPSNGLDTKEHADQTFHIIDLQTAKHCKLRQEELGKILRMTNSGRGAAWTSKTSKGRCTSCRIPGSGLTIRVCATSHCKMLDFESLSFNVLIPCTIGLGDDG